MSQAIPHINDQKKPLLTPRWQSGGSAWQSHRLVPARDWPRLSTVALPSSAPAPRNEKQRHRVEVRKGDVGNAIVNT